MVLFTDGFETNDFSNWTASVTAGAGANTVITTWAKEGTHSYQSDSPDTTTDYAYIHKDSLGTTSAFNVRFYIKITDTTGLGAGGFERILRVCDTSLNLIDYAALLIENADRNLTLRYYDSGLNPHDVVSATKLSLDTVYCIELEIRIDGSANASFKVYLNAGEVLDLTTAGIAQGYYPTYIPNELMIGMVSLGTNAVHLTMLWDSIVVDSSYIGCLAAVAGAKKRAYYPLTRLQNRPNLTPKIWQPR